jgi:hypothetical protein
MSVPSSWIGGNSSQVAAVREHFKAQGAQDLSLLDEMWYKSRRVDAYFVNVDVSGVTTGVYSSLELDVVSKTFKAEQFTDEMWQYFATIPFAGYPQNATTQYLASTVTDIDNVPTHCATFKTKIPGRGSTFDIVCFVLLGSQRTHTIKFRADQAKFDAHVNDINEMLGSLRYR